MEETVDRRPTKPKWLRKLERESYQAELIISGLAIIGSLQLPALLEMAERYMLLHYDRDTLFIGYIASIYWRIFVTGLIVLFIFHFVVRALWIGMVGLNSVYPGGFKTNERFSKDFQEKLRKEYGDIDGFIDRLDRLGSGLFGTGFAVSGVFLNFGVLGIVCVLIHAWLVGKGVDPLTVQRGFLLLFVPLFVLSLVSMTLHTKRLQNGKVAQKYLWPITKWISRLSYPLAGRYIVTGQNLVYSYYADKKGVFLYFLAGMFAIFIYGVATALADPNIRYFLDPVYHRMGEDTTSLKTRYASEEGYGGIYAQPVLMSKPSLASTALSVWVPLPEREQKVMFDSCSVAPAAADMIRDEERRYDRKRTVDCAREYISVRLNDRAVQPASIKRQSVDNAAGLQHGVRLELTGLANQPGDNLLEVTTKYPHEDSGEPRRTYTPYFLLPEEGQ